MVCVLSVQSVHAQSKKQSSEYGRRLEVEINLTAEQIAKFANFKPPAANFQPMSPIDALTATTEDWTGDRINADKDKGPYSMVVTLKGKAKQHGDVSTLWTTGWATTEGAANIVVLPGLSKLNVKAGEALELTKVSAPTRFKETRAVRPMLSLIKAENIDIESIHIQVWSGIGENSWRDTLMAFRWLGLGLIFFLLRWWWVKR
ncbi:hypothetical protein [Undibacterium fentianense]|uniref:Uncharacterized protein n=1 Tax=Undibacterium fentianense TaxID=2828728 RepID=A0A941E619_9BURK|nr:hypothetical protein [Undibacterium fentianense]MBR7801747.1 hypothetical protein [Undibacterium fentianense]